jgi:hypothetical protein
MNKEAILSHLTEAAQQLLTAIESLKTDSAYEVEQYRVEMSHVYHHLNTAWNGRNGTEDEFRNAEKFDEWGKLPETSDLFL